jgi:rfaE bifunctional protein kinase chain/domain
MIGQRAREVIDRFAGTRVLSVGDVMLDEYIWGEVRRVSPEAPVPVVEVRRRTYVPGGAANTAAGAVSLGGRASVAGVVGDDEAAATLRRALEDRGIASAALVVDAVRPTTVKTRIVASNQQVVRTDVEDRAPLRKELERELLSRLAEEVAAADAVILSDYAKGVVSPAVAQGVIELASRWETPVVADPKGGDYAKYRGAAVVTPNIHEAKRAAGLDAEGYGDLAEICQTIAPVLGGTALLVTRGVQGMSLFVDGRQLLEIPALAKNVFDVTGAGDTVATTLAIALGCGSSLEDAATLANAAAGVVVGKVGTAPPTLDELRAEAGR